MTTRKTTEPPQSSNPHGQTAPKTAGKPAAKPDAKEDSPKVDASSSKSAPTKETTPPASAEPDAVKTGSGSGFVWIVALLILIGGAVTVGWPFLSPYVGDTVRPAVEDLRTRLGLTPRPTQLQMPDVTIVATPPAEQSAEPLVSPEPQVEPTPQVEPEGEAGAEPVAKPAPEAAPEPTSLPQPAEASGDGPAVEALASRLDVLESQLAAVSTADGQAALAQTSQLAQMLADLKSRLDSMDATLAELSARQTSQTGASVSAQALVLAATQLRVRLMGDGPFAAELAALERIAGEDAVVLDAVGRLRPHAEVGVPSKADLTARFAAVAADIVRANTASGEAGWLATLKNSVSGLVTVRRTDPTKITDDVERSVAVAEAALQAGALDEAIAALNVLQGAPGEAAAAWLGDARARVDVEAALESLYNQALAAMAQVDGV